MTVKMEVEWKEKKRDARKRVRKAVWAHEGRLSGRGSFHRMEMGSRTTVAAWVQRIVVGTPQRAVR
jgi:hypothetical protein